MCCQAHGINTVHSRCAHILCPALAHLLLTCRSLGATFGMQLQVVRAKAASEVFEAITRSKHKKLAGMIKKVPKTDKDTFLKQVRISCFIVHDVKSASFCDEGPYCREAIQVFTVGKSRPLSAENCSSPKREIYS